MNVAETASTVAVAQTSIGGTTLTDLITGKTVTASGGSYSISVDGLSGRLLQVK